MDVRQIAVRSRRIDVDLELPGSKSMTNRCLLAAGLASGRSHLRRVLYADDTEAMLDCIRALGAEVEVDRDSAEAIIDGVDGHIAESGTAFARQSGTTARFVAPVLALSSGPWRLDGDPQLRARPMGDLFTALSDLGVRVTGPSGSSTNLPVEILGPILGSKAAVSGATSSQFLSGLLQAAPLTREGLSITVTGDLVSRPYVEMTCSTMRDFGAAVGVDGAEYRVEPGGYRAASLAIEPDASAASYFLAAGAVTGGRVRVRNLGTNSVQGDREFARVLAAMGAQLEESDDSTEITGGGRLQGVQVDCSQFSDTVPTIAVVAALANSPTTITGVGFIRAKESDRIGAVVTELRRCGIDASEPRDGMVINPGGAHGAQVHTYGDHRIAMAFSVLGLVVPGMAIEDPICVAKTFPEFFDVLDNL